MLLLRLSALINAGFGAQGGGTRGVIHLVLWMVQDLDLSQVHPGKQKVGGPGALQARHSPLGRRAALPNPGLFSTVLCLFISC